jgi:nicotinamidase-related amidase
MLQVLSAARKTELRMFYALHHRYRPGDYETWKYVAPIQKAAWLRKTFENGTWGGEIRREFEPQSGEIVDQEHWGFSGFANTDLDLQLKKHGIHQLIVMGLIAHTCLESTLRYAAENGYEVTVVNDAVADYSDEEMHAALDVNIPKLRQCSCDHKRSHRINFFSLNLGNRIAAPTFGYYAASAPTLQFAPSESTNCASTPPKSCFLGSMLNRTPLALMSR